MKAIKVVLPKKPQEPVKPVWPFPTKLLDKPLTHVPPPPSLDNFEEALL